MSEKENKGTLPEEKTEAVSDEKLKDVAGGILFSAENIHRPMPGLERGQEISDTAGTGAGLTPRCLFRRRGVNR